MTPDKLVRLDETLGEFKNHRTVQDYFVGALAVMVSDEIWDECLKSAKSCALAHELEKREPVEAA